MTPEIRRRDKYGGDPEMPECEALHIVGYLIDVGVTMGEQPVTFGELESWQRQTGVDLEPWEIRFVKRLSEAYMSESHHARSPDAESPWSDAPYTEQFRSAVANRLKMMIRGVA